jgi:CheY-like chemotaxis protein
MSALLNTLTPKKMLKTAVIIDDDQDDLEILKETLESVDSSLRCICFSSPVKALQVLFDGLISTPDFIFTDINMPGMTGDQVVEELRNKHEYDETVITVSSTCMFDDVSENLINLGANYTFKKHHSMSMLERTVETILMHQQSSAVTKFFPKHLATVSASRY